MSLIEDPPRWPRERFTKFTSSHAWSKERARRSVTCCMMICTKAMIIRARSQYHSVTTERKRKTHTTSYAPRTKINTSIFDKTEYGLVSFSVPIYILQDHRRIRNHENIFFPGSYTLNDEGRRRLSIFLYFPRNFFRWSTWRFQKRNDRGDTENEKGGKRGGTQALVRRICSTGNGFPHTSMRFRSVGSGRTTRCPLSVQNVFLGACQVRIEET